MAASLTFPYFKIKLLLTWQEALTGYFLGLGYHCTLLHCVHLACNLKCSYPSFFTDVTVTATSVKDEARIMAFNIIC